MIIAIGLKEHLLLSPNSDSETIIRTNLKESIAG